MFGKPYREKPRRWPVI